MLTVLRTTRKRHLLSVESIGLFLLLVLCVTLGVFSISEHEQQYLIEENEVQPFSNFDSRQELLEAVCSKYSNPFRPEALTMGAASSSIGSEVIYLTSEKQPDLRGSVCIPHKVGSNSWGNFSRLVGGSAYSDTTSEQNARAIIVRHPMSRLVSVYRMIFEDWCDQRRFLARQWQGTVCNYDALIGGDEDESEDVLVVENGASVMKVMRALLDQRQHGNDRFMRAVWRRLNPGRRLTDPRAQLKFTFKEFAILLIDGIGTTSPGMRARSSGLSYHWAPYWKECSLCDAKKRPQYVLKLESFSSDLKSYLDVLGMGDKTELFPHTHNQGSSRDVERKLFGTLTKAEVAALYELYRLDHEMFGYDVKPYLDMAQ